MADDLKLRVLFVGPLERPQLVEPGHRQATLTQIEAGSPGGEIWLPGTVLAFSIVFTRYYVDRYRTRESDSGRAAGKESRRHVTRLPPTWQPLPLPRPWHPGRAGCY